MAFSAKDKVDIRRHLGYSNVQPASGLFAGVPVPMQTAYIIETAMDRVLPEAEDDVRRFIRVLNNIECKLIEAQDRLAAESLGDLRVRANEPDLLEKEYKRWAYRLAEILLVPVYPYANRFNGGGGAGNVPVS